MIWRPTTKSAAVFALTALPVAIVTAVAVANLGATEVATEAATNITASAVATTTTIVPAETVTSTTAAVTTTTVVALELSEATVAIQNQTLDWKRVSIGQCACSAEFPGATTQSSSPLPDGRPAHLVLSQSDSAISSALWTTTATVDGNRSEEMLTVLNAIAGSAQISNQVTEADRVRANMADGTTRAVIDVRSIGDKIVVLFIASSNGEGLDVASARFSGSLRS